MKIKYKRLLQEIDYINNERKEMEQTHPLVHAAVFGRDRIDRQLEADGALELRKQGGVGRWGAGRLWLEGPLLPRQGGASGGLWRWRGLWRCWRGHGQPYRPRLQGRRAVHAPPCRPTHKWCVWCECWRTCRMPSQKHTPRHTRATCTAYTSSACAARGRQRQRPRAWAVRSSGRRRSCRAAPRPW